jgi:DNA-directed RNA polymerase specialized sigma24 family protein
VLTPRERAWIVAVDGQGLSVAELARLENLERETVSRGLNRARRKLRDDRDDNMGDDES